MIPKGIRDLTCGYRKGVEMMPVSDMQDFVFAKLLLLLQKHISFNSVDHLLDKTLRKCVC